MLWLLAGWYFPDYTAADILEWGRGKGCDFLTESCSTWTGLGYTCIEEADLCTAARDAKGYCQVRKVCVCVWVCGRVVCVPVYPSPSLPHKISLLHVT